MRATKVVTVGLVGAAAAVVAGHLACTTSAPTTGSGPPAPDASANEIVIGVSNSLTGGLSGIGGPLHKAWTVAQTYVNANGGILGKNLRFVELDDATDDDTQSDDGGVVTGVAEKLLALNPAAVIGPNGSAQVDTVWQLFQQNHVVEISGTATSVEFETLPGDASPNDRYFFRTVPADDAQGKALALLAQLGPAGAGGALPDGGPLPAGGAGSVDGGGNACPTIALLYYSNAYGIPMSQVFKSSFPGTVVADQQLTEGEADGFSKQIKAISDAKADCLAMILYDTDGDAFLEAYQAAVQSGTASPLPAFVMGTDGVYDSTFLQSGLATPNSPPQTTIVEGMYGTNPDSNPTDPVNEPNYQFFKDLYVTEFPLPPGQVDVDAFASNEFDAAMLLALSVEKAGTATDGPAIRDALLSITNGAGKVHGPADLTGALEDILNGQAITYTGASGPCRLDPATGNTTAGYIIWQIQNGNFVTLKHIPASGL
jgi:ABC-type branched-subunit amino acid transport system substrate-binding protein